MDTFLDAPIQAKYFFANAPQCRTRREASTHYLNTVSFDEMGPSSSSAISCILHQITNPFSMGLVIDRQIAVQKDQRVRKSVRIGLSNLNAEKCALELINAKTSVPVPLVHNYYQSVEFEHLVMAKVPGTTLEHSWDTLSINERESIADQVVSFIKELHELHSPDIQAALVQRQPLQAKLQSCTEFCMERFKNYLWHESIAAYIRERSILLDGQPNEFTHGDLDWSNIMVSDKQACGILDLESAGYFPPYWEWISVKRLSQNLQDDSWFGLLEQRLAKEKRPGWDGMWEVEKLFVSLSRVSRWALTPEEREANRVKGWSEVCQIIGTDTGGPPQVTYDVALKHPWWLELVIE